MEYRKPIPDFLREAAATPVLLRLQHIGMHCGCQYTDFPVFRGLVPYSRYDHSFAVAQILWDFTEDPVQTLAGLLHDAATPVFSHVVDFLNGDHLTQESTEDGLSEIIKNDTVLMTMLQKWGIDPEDVCHCDRYPLADCSSPRLCADRLEYTLSNAVHYSFAADVQTIYNDLVVDINEDSAEELVFTSAETALGFAQLALNCGKVYVSDEDRYAMERLSRLLKKAMEEEILTHQDLYSDEVTVIGKLTDSSLLGDWQAFCRLHRVFTANGSAPFAYRIPAKKRYIDPLVRDAGRVSELFPEFQAQLVKFLSCTQDHWLCGE